MSNSKSLIEYAICCSAHFNIFWYYNQIQFMHKRSVQICKVWWTSDFKVCNIYTINYRPCCLRKAILFIVYSLPYDSLTPITNCESNASPFLSACTNFMAESCKRCLISQKMLWFQLSSISYNDKITVTSVLLHQLFLTNGIWTSGGCGHFVTSMWKFLLHVVNIL